MIFVIELQSLLVAIAHGSQGCVDPTGVALALRDVMGIHCD